MQVGQAVGDGTEGAHEVVHVSVEGRFKFVEFFLERVEGLSAGLDRDERHLAVQAHVKPTQVRKLDLDNGTVTVAVDSEGDQAQPETSRAASLHSRRYSPTWRKTSVYTVNLVSHSLRDMHFFKQRRQQVELLQPGQRDRRRGVGDSY